MKSIIRNTAFLLTSLLLLAGCAPPREVDVTKPRRGMIEETFRETARTRLSRTHLVSLPVDGRIGRIELEPGDAVVKGQTLVEYDLVPMELQVAELRAAVLELEASIAVLDDNRIEDIALVYTNATVEASREALSASDRQIEAQQARAERFQLEYDRVSSLTEGGAVSQSELDDARLMAEEATIQLREKEFSRAALRAMVVAIETGPEFIRAWTGQEVLERRELEQRLAQARARLSEAEHHLALASIKSPIDGVVLERFELGERLHAGGEPLLLLGSLADLEAVAEVLTQDAIRLEPGMPVRLSPRADAAPIGGMVKLIEPSAFTKLSSLGVEQQRVNVVIAFAEPPAAVGVGYRLEATFITGQRDGVIVVPRFSIQRSTSGDARLLTVESGRLREHTVTTGVQSDLEIEIVSGFSGAGADLVLTPDAEMADGQRVRAAATR